MQNERELRAATQASSIEATVPMPAARMIQTDLDPTQRMNAQAEATDKSEKHLTTQQTKQDTQQRLEDIEIENTEDDVLLKAAVALQEMQEKAKDANAEAKQPTITTLGEDLSTDEDIPTYINDGKNMPHKAPSHMQAVPMQWHTEHQAETKSAGIRPQYLMKKHQLQSKGPSSRCMMLHLPPQLI